MERPLDRNTPDAITELDAGDVLEVGRRKYRIVKPALGWIKQYAWLQFNGRRCSDLVPAENIRDTFASSKPGDTFAYASNGMSGTYLGEVQLRSAFVRAVDAGLVGVPKKKDIIDLCLNLFLSGDPEAFKLACTDDDIDMMKADVTKAHVPPAEFYEFTKWDLIPYVVEVNGPMPREEILQQVQRLQGRPYVPGSNNSYFLDDARGQHGGEPVKLGAISRGLLRVDHKKGNTLVYGVGTEGKKKAQEIIDQIGRQPGVKV